MLVSIQRLFGFVTDKGVVKKAVKEFQYNDCLGSSNSVWSGVKIAL